MDMKILIIGAALVLIAGGIGAAVLLMNNDDGSKEINSLDDLDGARIGVENGTTGDIYVTDEYEVPGKATIYRYDTYPDAIAALKNKKIDAIVMDKAPAEAYVQTNSGIKILETNLNEEQYGFIFNKSNTALRDDFNTALATLKANGKIAEIENYWLDASRIKGNDNPYIQSTGTGATITVATSPDFPPYDAMYGPTYTGIDMDIIRAICNELNLRVEFTQQNFDGVLTAVSTNNVDVGASGITITEERQNNVLFSDYYTTSVQVVVVRA